VAKILGISERTVYTMAENNEPPPHRIRSCLRFHPDDIDDYIFFSKFALPDGQFKVRPADKDALLKRIDERNEQEKSFVLKLLEGKQKRRAHEAVN
jgi:excisionase family DNA binding protein